MTAPAVPVLRREPAVLVAAVFAAWIAITIGGQLVQAGGAIVGLVELAGTAILWPVAAAAAWILVVGRARGWLPEIGLSAPARWRPYLVPALVTAAPLALVLGAGIPASIGIIVVNATLVGLSEELAFRGLLDRAARERLGTLRGIVLVAVVFGLVHALNGLLTGDYGPAVAQALVNIGAGLWYGAVRVRGGSIWPLVAIHAAWDVAGLAAGALGDVARLGATVLALGAIVLALYGVLLVVGIARARTA